MSSSDQKMKVEIWSDVVCPFCYIGKRRFEKALAQFPHKNNIEVTWKSFQLMPNAKTDTSINIDEFLAREKGIPLERAQQLNRHVTEMAKQTGLTYNFDKAIVANTFNSHRFIHFAKTQDKQDEAKERLLKAYFTEGKNIDDYSTLSILGQEIGLDTDGLIESLKGDAFTEDVNADINEAHQLGIRGVPFFAFDRKYAVSGAQEEGAFLQTLEKSYNEWHQATAKMDVIEGDNCSVDGDCN